MLDGVAVSTLHTSLNIATGYQFSNSNSDLDLYIDVELDLFDSGNLFTGSEDPSYLNRIVVIQALTLTSDGKYETFE